VALVQAARLHLCRLEAVVAIVISALVLCPWPIAMLWLYLWRPVYID